MSAKAKAMRPKVVMKWSKKENDWICNYPDRHGKGLSGILFGMTRTTGHRTDWGQDLIGILSDKEYDFTTFKITVEKKPKTEDKGSGTV